jgi:hypothetical protein
LGEHGTLVIDAGAVANGLVPAGTPATIRGLGGYDDGARDRAFGQNDRTLFIELFRVEVTPAVDKAAGCGFSACHLHL